MSIFELALGPGAISIETELPLPHLLRAGITSGARPMHRLCPTGARRSAHVRHIVAERPSVSADPDLATMTVAAPATQWTAQELFFVACLLLERQLQLGGLVTLHAAAVARQGRAVLLLGKTGAGKTCTAVRLCRQHGFELVGNDLCVVGGTEDAVEAVAGTTGFRLRLSSVARVLPELLGLFPSTRVADAWRTKIDVPPHQAGVRIAPLPAEVAVVAFVHVDSDYPALVDRPSADLVQRLDLYENALRYIRGGSTPWLLEGSLGLGPFVPSLDDHATHVRRTATLERLLVRARYVAGPLPLLAAHLADLLDHSADERRADRVAVQEGTPCPDRNPR